jgi:hypothetical protein
MSGLRVGFGILLAGALLLLAGCNKNQAPFFQGWVEAELIFVSPDDSGRIETLAVREGDQVEQRALVFQLDTELQQADVHTASAQVAEQRARIARLESAQQRREEVAVLQAQEKRAESAVTLSSARCRAPNSSVCRHSPAVASLRNPSLMSPKPMPRATAPTSMRCAGRSRSRVFPRGRRTLPPPGNRLLPRRHGGAPPRPSSPAAA